jgi:hypothetical protein
MIWWMLACLGGVGDKGASDGGPDSGPDSGVAGCDASVFASVGLEAAPMDMVFWARWSAVEAVPTRTVMQTSTGRSYTSAWGEPAVEGEHLIFGTPAGAQVSVTIEADLGHCVASSEVITGQAGALPADLVPPAATWAEVQDGFVAVPLIGVEQNHALILDGAGDVVWYASFPWWLARAHMSLDGRSLVGINGSPGKSTDGHVEIVDLATGERTRFSVPGIHTDLTEISPGRFAVAAWEIREFVDGEGVVHKMLGDRVLVLEDGQEPVELWNVYTWFTPDLGRDWYKGWYLADPEVEDWSHLNGLDHEEEEGALYLSLTGLQQVVKVDVETGEQLWSMGVPDSDFPDSGGLILQPHGVQGLPGDRILVFNRRRSTEGACSTVDELAYDVAAGTVGLVWKHQSTDCHQVHFLGNAHRLEGGDTLVSWSTAGVVDRVSPEGEVVWSLGWPEGSAQGFVEWRASFP